MASAATIRTLLTRRCTALLVQTHNYLCDVTPPILHGAVAEPVIGAGTPETNTRRSCPRQNSNRIGARPSQPRIGAVEALPPVVRRETAAWRRPSGRPRGPRREGPCTHDPRECGVRLRRRDRPRQARKSQSPARWSSSPRALREVPSVASCAHAGTVLRYSLGIYVRQCAVHLNGFLSLRELILDLSFAPRAH